MFLPFAFFDGDIQRWNRAAGPLVLAGKGVRAE
jgi:hypothetical protein